MRFLFYVFILMFSACFSSCTKNYDHPSEFSSITKSDFEILFDKAQKGDLDSQLVLYRIYANHERIEYDDKQAFFWAEKAANQNSGAGMIALGDCYLYGRGVSINEKKANDWRSRGLVLLKNKAQKGNVRAMLDLGISYLFMDDAFFETTEGAKNNREAGKYWLEKAVNSGSREAKVLLAGLLGQIEGNASEAVALLKEMSDKNYSLASLSLGFIYLDGEHVSQNVNLAFKYLMKAASSGHPLALRYIGDCYLNGIGVEKNKGKAIEYYKKAIGKGDRSAVYRLYKIDKLSD